MTTLPLGFDVPDGWTPVDPGQVGAEGAAFVAVRSGPGGEFTANITVGVRQRPDPASIAEIAEEAVEGLGRTVAGLEVLSRRPVGGQAAPGMTQVLRLRTGEGLDLVQTQVHLTVPGAEPAGRIVLELACTATPEDARALTGDFQRFVGSVHVRHTEGETQ
ncbi:hypothetical protein [Amycolatopsis samaneae]|uniref:DUF1795 domain-containing protein n=1 Tax=Amycolatopsis samaneae TaxID=664691 RepID=A0ABW5GNV7_9PSEU